MDDDIHPVSVQITSQGGAYAPGSTGYQYSSGGHSQSSGILS